ncbi:MAG: exonuclease domain-containing protein, partial [Candidatus Cloacimonetes bacterium]|nr:DNA polymerase III subunit epsilon [Candidatus Cloacimonadota bacterium]MCK9185644.1 exonuclease domain-containing protein [Candidatus Cloacimonadota bacterium]
MTFSETLNFVAIDIETTGLSEQRDEIIEIAAVRFAKGKAAERFVSLVKP